MSNQFVKTITKDFFNILLISLIVSIGIAFIIYGVIDSKIINFIVLILIVILIIIRIVNFSSVSDNFINTLWFIGISIVFVVVIGSVSYLNSEYDFIRYVQKILPIVSLLVLSGLTFTDLKLKELFEKINFDSDFSKSTF